MCSAAGKSARASAGNLAQTICIWCPRNTASRSAVAPSGVGSALALAVLPRSPHGRRRSSRHRDRAAGLSSCLERKQPQLCRKLVPRTISGSRRSARTSRGGALRCSDVCRGRFNVDLGLWETPALEQLMTEAGGLPFERARAYRREQLGARLLAWLLPDSVGFGVSSDWVEGVLWLGCLCPSSLSHTPCSGGARHWPCPCPWPSVRKHRMGPCCGG